MKSTEPLVPTQCQTPNAQWHDLHDPRIDRTWRIFISPPKHCSTEPSPCLFMLDGNGTFPIALAARETNPALATLALVGVGYPEESAFSPERRYFDLTPPTDLSRLPKRYGPVFPCGGQAEFARFIREILLPVVRERLAPELGTLSLFGHSLGGLFTLHMALTQPGIWAQGFASSPSLWFNREAVAADIATARTLIAKGNNDLSRLTLSAGSREAAYMQGEVADLAAALSVLNLDKPVSALTFAGETHISVLPVALNKALQWAADPDLGLAG